MRCNDEGFQTRHLELLSSGHCLEALVTKTLVATEYA
jgi:hypothetical protein